MDTPIKPIFLLADSQLLFWSPEGGPFLQRILALFASDELAIPLKAAYIGHQTVISLNFMRFLWRPWSAFKSSTAV